MKTKFKDSEVGKIPEDWKVKKLSQISELKRGKFTPRPRNNPIYYGGLIPFVQTGDVTNSNGKIINYTQTLNEEGLKVSAMFPKGTILMTIAANIGYSGILQSDMACPDSLVAISGIDGFSNLFLNYYFTYKRIDIENLSTSGAQKNLNLELLKPFPIPLPPTLAEQEAIATVLSDTDALIESIEKIIEKKKSIQQGAMQELLTGKRRLPGFGEAERSPSPFSEAKQSVRNGVGGRMKETEVGFIPEDWMVKKLGDVGRFSKGQGVRKDESNSGEIPCIRYGEIYTIHNDYIKKFNSFISKIVALTAKKLTSGDILFAGSGETKEEIGKCVSFINSFEAYAGGDIVILSPQNSNSTFLGYLLNAPIIQKQKASRGQGDAVVHISASQLSQISILLPPTLAEQEAIAQVLSDMDQELEGLEKKLKKTRDLKQGLMQLLLTGKIRLV